MPFKKATRPPEHSIEQVYGRYREELKVYFSRNRSVRKWTEDLVQETYLRLVIHPGLDGKEDPKGFFFWLARRVMCSASARLRKEARSSISFNSLSEEAYTALSRLLVVDDSSDNVDGEDLRRNLAALPPEQLRLLELHYVQRLTVEQISEMTETNPNTVKGRLKQVMQHMRDCYGDGALKKQVRKQQRRAQ